MYATWATRQSGMTRTNMATRRRPRRKISRGLQISLSGLALPARYYTRLVGLAIGLALLGVLYALIRPGAELTAESTARVPAAPQGNNSMSAASRNSIDAGSVQLDQAVLLATLDASEDPGDGPDWKIVRVQPGETLERIFTRLNLGPGLLHQVVHVDASTRQLARIRPGDEFAFYIDPEDGFRALRAELDDQNWLYVEHGPGGLSSRTEKRDMDIHLTQASGEITSSLFNAAKGAGLSDNMTMRLANIFGWDIDFALEIRAGDRFALVFEEIYRDGEFLRHGAILAARFVNQGRTYEAVRFDAGNGPDFYAPDGSPMRKAFLRAPLNFTRVTSNFNPRRFHPITRRVRPHNGTDYGASTGTPVWAAGDGRVIESAYNSANGNYVFIQHGNNIVTRYLHLSRREVRRGDRVRQGQTLGRVGATGLATGPHLHYEFLVNGAHRNPRTVDIPTADPLPDEHMPAFRALSTPLLAQLESIDSGRLLLASHDTESCRDESRGC